MKKRIRSEIKFATLISVIVLFATTAALGQEATSLSLDSCSAMAKRNYPLIKQYELIAKTKEYTLSNASKAYLPQVSITAIEGYIFGGLPSLGPGGGSAGSSSDFKFIGIAQINQTIWDGGATKTSKKIIEASSETEKASINVALYELNARVNQLYFGILLMNEQLAQLAIHNSILNNNVSRLKQLNENGLAYKTDLDEIRVEQLKLNQKRTEFTYVRNGYQTMLSALIGSTIGERTVLQKPMISNTLSAMEIARPELSLYNTQRSLVNAQAGMQRVSLMPKLGLLGAGVMLAPGIGNENNTSIGVAGLSASWSTSGLYKHGNEKRLTQQALSKINVQEETFRFNTKLQMTQTSANIEKQKAILTQDEEIVTLQKSIRESYQLKYDAGSGSLIDLLNATENESEARIQKALHEIQLLMTLAEYTQTTGNLK